MMRRAPFIVGLVLGILSPTLASASDPRFATVFDESIIVGKTEKPASSSGAEGALIQALIRSGWIAIDESQAQVVRRANAQDLFAGKVPKGLTSEDADLIIAAVVRGRTLRPMGLDIFGCQLTADVRVIAVDTAEVIASLSEQVMERDITPEGAIHHAGKKLATRLNDKLREEVAARRSRVELLVRTNEPIGVALTEKIAQAVRALPNVSKAEVTHSDTKKIELSIETRQTTRELALELSQRQDSGLYIWGYSKQAIKADFRPGGLMRLGLLPIEFRPRTRAQKSWVGRAIPENLGLALGQLDYIDAPSQSELWTSPKAPGRKDIEKLGFPADKTLLVSGTYLESHDRVSIQARIDTATGGSLVADSSDCDKAELTSCTNALAQRLSTKLFSAVQTKLPKITLAEPASAPKPLSVRSVSLTDIYPARLFRYGAQTKGSEDRIEIENRGTSTIENLILEATIPGFAATPVSMRVDKLAPKAKTTVPLRLVLDRDRLRTHDSNQPAVLELKLRYEADGFVVEDKHLSAVTVYHRNALTWNERQSVGAFVTPTSDAVQTLAKQAAASVPASFRGDMLALPVAIFELLSHLEYTRDPVNPYSASSVDYVQFPEETLARGAGDCDDLAVLYAALGEAIGLPILLVMTPGHIYVAVPTPMPTQSLTSQRVHEAGFIEHAGRLWVPLETTKLGDGFDAAWTLGATLYKDAKKRGQAQIISVREAWTEFAPTNLAPISELVPPHADKTRVEASIRSATEKLHAELSRAVEELDQQITKTRRANLLNRKGVLLVALGRFDEAKAAFTRGHEVDRKAPEPINNLGNLELLDGRPRAALERYGDAAKHTKQASELERRIVLNRLFAAWAISPNGPAFLDLVMETNDQDLRAFYQAVKGGPLRAGTSEQEGAAHLRRAIEQPGREEVPTESARVGRLIHWL